MVLLFVGDHRPRLCGSTRPCRRRSCPTRTRATSSSRCRRPTARRSSTRATSARQAEKVLLKRAGARRGVHGHGFSFAGASPNRGILFISLKPLRRAARRIAVGAGDRRAAARGARRHQRRARAFRSCRRPSAVSARFGGFQFEVLDQTRRPDREPRPPSRRASCRRATSRPAAARAVLDVHDRRPAAAREHRSRAREERSDMSAQRGHRRAAGVPRVAVRERLRLQQPRVSRVRPGRSAASATIRRHWRSSTPGRQTATWCRSRISCTCARRPRRRSSATSTCSARRRSTARAAPGFSSGQALLAMQSLAERTLPHGHDLRVGRAVARGDQGGHAGRSSSSGSACCSST